MATRVAVLEDSCQTFPVSGGERTLGECVVDMVFRSVKDVVEWRLCLGCGACAPACQKNYIVLEGKERQGIRPRLEGSDCGTCSDCLMACPGLNIQKEADERGGAASLKRDWGQILEIWEGYAADEELRYSSSSGGAASAIALYCLEKQGIGQVFHTAADDKFGLMNRTVFSRSKAELVARTGSRYAPASPCGALGDVAKTKLPSVFIGKPCDIQGLTKFEEVRPEIQEKIACVISIFCAGTPSTGATIRLIESLHVSADQVRQIRYRGRGWPGNFAVWTDGGDKPTVEISYLDAWSFLQRYRPYRCYLCPDGTGELADISCGDPWYRRQRDNAGYSLILLRTERGRAIFYKAMESGYIKAEQRETEVLPLSQPGFPQKRGAIWGRLLAMKLFGIPTPVYDGWPLYQCWKQLPAKEKARSILGTIRRIVRRKYYRPEKQETNEWIKRSVA